MSIQANLQIRRGEFRLDVDLDCPARGVTALFGPSGCGKTSILRALAGLDRHDGLLRVADEVWQDPQRFVPAHRRSVGYVFQEASLFPHLAVRGNLEYGLRRVRAGERRVDFAGAVGLLGLESLLERRSQSLSGGQRQRVAIARALLASPRLLLMDEPLSGLDAASKAEILPYLERLHEQLSMPVLYVSHQPDEVARLADHLVLLGQDGVLGAGPIADMLTRVDLPLAHGDEAEAIVRATVTGHDPEFHLTFLEFPGGCFSIARKPLQEGTAVRLRVLARDVSLTLQRQTGTSILNIFPARVMQLADENPAQMIVRLEAGGVPLLARITRKSAATLGLAVGGTVYAQVKTVALLG